MKNMGLILDLDQFEKGILAKVDEKMSQMLSNVSVLISTPERLTSKEAARILGVYQNTILNLVKSGQLKNVSPHRNIVIERTDLLKYKAEIEENNGLTLLLDRLKIQ